MVRVMVADDQPMVLAALALLLDVEPDLEVVARAAGGEEAVATLASIRVDVAVVDVRMPGCDGVEVVRACVAEPNAPRFLMLTSYRDEDALVASLEAGARGFLLKDAAPHHLGEAVRAVAAGDGWLDPAVTPFVIARFAHNDGVPLISDARIDTLTPRERDVLMLLGQGRSNAEIGARLFVAETTVKSHVSAVLMKLRVRDRLQAALVADALRPRQ